MTGTPQPSTGDSLKRDAVSKRVARRLALGVGLVALAIWVGSEYGHRLPELEAWIASQGALGWLVFIACAVVLTSVFVPEAPFAVMAGAMFGVAGGTALAVFAAWLTAATNFAMSRFFLRNAVEDWLAQRPKLAAIERAVQREGLRFQLLLRLTPIHPVTVSYVLGATGTRFPVFMTACLGLIPAIFVEAYIGAAAVQVAKASSESGQPSQLRTAFTLVGLALCIALLIHVVRLARGVLRRYEDLGRG